MGRGVGKGVRECEQLLKEGPRANDIKNIGEIAKV